jgi:post-segregation antitoxin (ccd killing protein)
MSRSKIMKKRQDLKAINVRVPRNIVNRLKRRSAIEGISQAAIVYQALERELIAWEKGYAEKMEIQKKFEKVTGVPADKDLDNQTEKE